MYDLPVKVAARSKARSVFDHLNTSIVCSNPTEGMNVCVYSVFSITCIDSDFTAKG
jgi:hypothetical protein